MSARTIAEIISLHSHARTVRSGPNEEVGRPPHKEHQPDPRRLREAAGIINKLFAELQACFPAWKHRGQFVRWCQPDPSDYGLPSPESAFREASRNAHPAAGRDKWSHPAVFVAARETGSYELSNLPQAKSWPIFKRAYNIAVRRVFEGESLDAEIPKA